MYPIVPATPVDTLTSVPGGVWASALRTRLCATWARRSPSPSTTTGRPGLEGQVVAVGHRVGVAHRVGADALQVDRLRPQRPAPVQLGQQQEVLDQAAHPGRLLLDPLERLAPPGLVGEAAPPQQLGVAPDGGERRAQLVRGVGHELAQALLGGRLLGEGPLDLGQHLVEGRRRGGRPRSRGACSGTRRVRSPEAMASAVPAIWRSGRRPRRTTTSDQHAHGQEHGQAGEQLHLAQRVQRVVGRVERDGGHERPLGDGDGDGAVLRRRGRPCCRGPPRRRRGGTCRRSARRGRGW